MTPGSPVLGGGSWLSADPMRPFGGTTTDGEEPPEAAAASPAFHPLEGGSRCPRLTGPGGALIHGVITDFKWC